MIERRPAQAVRSSLRRVEWLADLLDISRQQTYDAIANRHIPPACIKRIGRRIRVIEERVYDWLAAGSQ